MLYHQKHNLVGSKDYIEQNKSSSWEIKCRIARIEVDNSSWNLNSWPPVKKSNLPILWNFVISSCYFVCLVHISLLRSLLVMVFFQFQDNRVSWKQVPHHNHEHMIFQPGQWEMRLIGYVSTTLHCMKGQLRQGSKLWLTGRQYDQKLSAGD